MNTYTYYDNNQQKWDVENKINVGKVIFQVEAEDILMADKKLKVATGIDPVKATHIGCVTHFLKG